MVLEFIMMKEKLLIVLLIKINILIAIKIVDNFFLQFNNIFSYANFIGK